MRMSIKTATVGIVLVTSLTACSSGSEKSQPTSVPTNALAQMEIAFEGSPQQATLQSALDKAFAAVNMTETEDNLSRAGSTLVAMRKEYGISEMDILACMPYRAEDPRAPAVNFPNVAAVCVTDLASGVTVP